MRYRVIIAPEAEADLRKAGSYIRRDNPGAARAWLKGARQRIKTLARHPENQPLSFEITKRLTYGDAADAVLQHQLAFRRQAVILAVDAIDDPGTQRFLDLRVERNRVATARHGGTNCSHKLFHGSVRWRTAGGGSVGCRADSGVRGAPDVCRWDAKVRGNAV